MGQRLGVIVPMSAETGVVFGFKRWHRSNHQTIKIDSTHSGLQLLCIRSGIGPEKAAVAAQWLIDQRVNALAVVGVAGALNPELRIGDLVIPEIIHQTGQRRNCVKLCIDPSISESLYRLLTAEGFHVHRGILLTTDHPVLTQKDKSALFLKFGAQAVDMETAPVLRKALDHHLPFVAIRSIGDRAATDIPSILFQSLRPEGSVNQRRLLSASMLNPYLILRILCIGADFFHALRVLKSAWQLLLRKNGILSIPKEQAACGGRGSCIRI